MEEGDPRGLQTIQCSVIYSDERGEIGSGGGGVSILLVYLTVRGPAQSCREQAIDR